MREANASDRARIKNCGFCGGRIAGRSRHGWRASKTCLGVLTAVALCRFAAADTLLLRGGEKLVGRLVSEEGTKVVFESQTLGRLEIERKAIEQIEQDAGPQTTSSVSTNVSTPPAASTTNRYLPWVTGPPGSDALDWIQLKSGEWLVGKIKSLQEEKLEFDSEKLDLLTFDWKDILTIRSPRLNSVRIEGLKPIDGSLLVTTNQVQVFTPTTTNTYPRSDLIAIAPTGHRELDKWSAKIATGVSFRDGNTRELDLSAQIALLRRTPNTRFRLEYLGNYGKVNGVETEQNHNFTGQFDYFLSRRLYVRVPDLEYFRDPLQNLDHRLTLGAGVGYDLVKTRRTEWNVTVGPAWQRNWFGSVPSGENGTADSVALVLSSRFDIELTQRLDWILQYRGQLTEKETGNSTHHAESTLEFEIHKRLKLDLSFVWDRISDPKTESDLSTPKPDDFRLITALGVDF